MKRGEEIIKKNMMLQSQKKVIDRIKKFKNEGQDDVINISTEKLLNKKCVDISHEKYMKII